MSGIICAHNFIGGSGVISPDLSGNGNDISIVEATWEEGGLLANAVGEKGLLPNIENAVINSNEGTVIIKVKSLSSVSDGLFRFLFGYGIGDEGNFSIYKASNSTLYFIFNDVNGAHYVTIGASDLPNWESGTQIACVWNRNEVIWNSDKMVINVDGAHVIPTFQDEETAWDEFNVDNSMGILNNANIHTLFFNGYAEYLGIADYALSEEELMNIYNDSSIMFSSEKKTKTYYSQVLYK